MVEVEKKVSFGACGDLPSTQIDMGGLEEDKSLEVLMAMLCNSCKAVKTCHSSTNAGVYNQFNSRKFLVDLGRIKGFVEREFPPVDE